ncbi:MAG: hypothetical protein HQL87_06920 [Magnetococcales bacterium]|nr:hypothetical protein [Magnetococcales bacterium]
MNERVKAYRERQKAAGLSQVSLWLDDPTARLLKQTAETQQQTPGELVTMALHAWWTRPDTTAPHKSDSTPTVMPDAGTLREWVRQMVHEELTVVGMSESMTSNPDAEGKPTDGMQTAQPIVPVAEIADDPIKTAEENRDALPRSSLYKWPIAF